MTAAWPGELPDHPIATFTEEREENRYAFDVQAGPAKLRPKWNASTKLQTMTFIMTSEQVDALEAFYADTLLQGTQPFTFTDPRKCEEGRYQFAAPPGNNGQIGRRSGTRLWSIPMTLRRLP